MNAKLRRVAGAWALGVIACTVACAGSSTSPSSPTPATAFGQTILLSGQSNAVNLRPALAAAYTPGVISISEANQRIREWAQGGRLWQQLEPELHRPLTAFVWWQGETDGFDHNDAYAAQLADLLARVRQTNGNPQLLVVVVRVLLYRSPIQDFDNAFIRSAQERVVSTDPAAVLVSVDDLPGDGQAHLAFPDGYTPAAERILAAIRGRSR